MRPTTARLVSGVSSFVCEPVSEVWKTAAARTAPVGSGLAETDVHFAAEAGLAMRLHSKPIGLQAITDDFEIS